MKIAHLTSAHPRTDLRIFGKQCKSLATYGYDVELIVADGLGDAHQDGISIYDVGRISGRVRRSILLARRVCQKALQLQPDVCHLHDPELLLHAGILRRSGIKVVYDAHEDLPSQVAAKPYIPIWGQKAVARLARIFLNYKFVRLDAVITATEHIAKTIPTTQKRVCVVRNYPFRPTKPASVHTRSRSTTEAEPQVLVYAGNISHLRGVLDLVDALALTKTDVQLELYGKVSSPEFLQTLKASPGWDKVNFHGYVHHDDVTQAMKRAICGIVVLHPTHAYQHSLPIKMFEYMAASIPVIASDFPLWRSIVSETGCGLCVEPNNPQKLAQKIEWLVEHPEEAYGMGKMGFDAITSSFNWESEEEELKAIYRTIL